MRNVANLIGFWCLPCIVTNSKSFNWSNKCLCKCVFCVTKEIELLNRMAFLFPNFPVRQNYAFKSVILCLCVILTSSFLIGWPNLPCLSVHLIWLSVPSTLYEGNSKWDQSQEGWKELTSMLDRLISDPQNVHWKQGWLIITSEQRESIIWSNTEKAKLGLEAVRFEWHEYTWLCNIHQNHQFWEARTEKIY